MRRRPTRAAGWPPPPAARRSTGSAGPGRPGETGPAGGDRHRYLPGGRGRRRRAARHDLRLLPSRAAARVADRAHPARRLRPDHGRDRDRLPGRRARDDPAAAAGAQGAPRRRRGHARARPRPARGPAGRGAGRGVPGLQRGLPGQRGPAARPPGSGRPGGVADQAAAPADAARARGPRPARAAPAARVEGRDPVRRLGAPGQARGPGPQPVEPGADRRGHRVARPRAGAARPRALPGPGGYRRAARAGPRLRAHRLAPDPPAVRPAAGA